MNVFESGVLVLDVQYAVLERSSFSYLDIMYCKFDDATRWTSVAQECFLLACVNAETEAINNECIPRNHIFMVVQQGGSGLYYRSGLMRVSCWAKAHPEQKRIQLG